MDIKRLFRDKLPKVYYACREIDEITDGPDPHSNAIDAKDERSAMLRAAAMFQEMAIAAQVLATGEKEPSVNDVPPELIDGLHTIYAIASEYEPYLQDRFAAEDTVDFFTRRIKLRNSHDKSWVGRTEPDRTTPTQGTGLSK